MDFWQKARSVAGEAAKRSQDLTVGTSKLTDVMSQTAKLSKEIATEASRRAGQIRNEAIKGADRIKSSFADGRAAEPTVEAEQAEKDKELEAFAITEELRDFVKEISITTFQDFPLPDDSEMSNVPTVSNVRQDLTEWQAKHANLVLSTVKVIIFISLLDDNPFVV
uniref:BSD domain-containing protein n=1 Tax=Rhizophora mucronata TaxID=61149 RepID=A0A2P2IMJ0_RHIMU